MRGARSVIIAILVIPAAARVAWMVVVSVSIQIGGGCFERRIMQRISTSVSGPRRFLRVANAFGRGDL